MSTIKESRKKRKSFQINILLACVGIYVLLQVFILTELFPKSSKIYSLLRREKHKRQSYISFLAAIITPEQRLLDKDCLWKMQNNRTFMTKLERLLLNHNKNQELNSYIESELIVCVAVDENYTQYENATLQKLNVPQKALQNMQKELKKVKTGKANCLVSQMELSDQLKIDLTITPPTIQEIEKIYFEMFDIGGFYPGPKFCKPRQTTAIIIPFRDRELHLRYWLYYTLQTLIKQDISFQVFVVEQADQSVFNKGQLMNTAFNWITEHQKTKFDCFIFHDVDMIPEIPGNFYICSVGKVVMHLAPFMDKYNYTGNVKHGITVGGAVAFKEWQFKSLNGYSNQYWGWGGEDDDMNLRIKLSGLKRMRPIWEYGRYKMVQHDHDHGNPVNEQRHVLLKAARERYDKDGLIDLNTDILGVNYLPAFTHIQVKVSPQPAGNFAPPIMEKPKPVVPKVMPANTNKKIVSKDAVEKVNNVAAKPAAIKAKNVNYAGVQVRKN